jgi:hypothetical protein
MEDSSTSPQSLDEDRPFSVSLGVAPDKIDLPLWPMLRADVSAAAQCLVPLLIVNSYRVFGDQAPNLTVDIASRLIGADDEAAVADLVRIGFLSVNGASLTYRLQPPLGYEGPRDLSEACALYGDSELYGGEGLNGR